MSLKFHTPLCAQGRVTCTATADGETYTGKGRDLYHAARALLKALRKAGVLPPRVPVTAKTDARQGKDAG